MEIANDMPVETRPEIQAEPQTETGPEPETPRAQESATGRIGFSTEIVLYIALTLLALTLRLPDLGTIPLGDREAHEALAAFRAISNLPESQLLVAHNPLMFTANVLLMSAVGGDTGTARLPTVLVGVLLVLSPLLFRRWLGASRALIVAGLLAISPVLLLSSRSMGGSVWSMVLALAGIYFAARFAETRRTNSALVASAAFALLVLMTEPAGFVIALGLVVGIAFAAAAHDVPDNLYRRVLGETLRGWPWLAGLIAAGVAVGLVGTVFMLYPRGLSGLGDVLGQALAGLITRPAGYPFAYPLLVSLLYEPVLWIFGLIGVYWVLTGRNEETDETKAFIQRLFVGWLGLSLVAALVYQGAQPYHALWLTIPLAGLSAGVVEKAISPVRDRLWEVPAWGPFLHAAGVVAMFAITGINLVLVARMIQGATPDVLPGLDPTQRVRLIFIVPSILLIIITFFLVGSIWGSRAPWHGLGMGALVFFGLFSLGTGWRAAVVNADNPRELWQVHPAARNLNLLLTTLTTASGRVTGMPYDMALDVVTGPQGLSSDSALAWALRRYTKAQYVSEVAPDTDIPVIIEAESAKAPKVTGAYVGQHFPLYYSWDRSELSWDILSWIYDRQTRLQPQGSDYIVAWVRSDVYGVSNTDNSLAPGTSGASSSSAK